MPYIIRSTQHCFKGPSPLLVRTSSIHLSEIYKRKNDQEKILTQKLTREIIYDRQIWLNQKDLAKVFFYLDLSVLDSKLVSLGYHNKLFSCTCRISCHSIGLEHSIGLGIWSY